jgi:hypothetical protein
MKDQRVVTLFVFFLLSLTATSLGIKSLDDIQVGGTYHMVLSTGDELEGVVYSKDDTTLVLDCKGKPYTFRGSLVTEYKLLAPPLSKKDDSPSSPGPELLTYERLQQDQPTGKDLEVSLKSGKTFRGSLVSIDSEFIKLNVDNSVIPIAQAVIDRIMTVSVQKMPPAAVPAKPEVAQIYDTIIVKSSEIDSLGKPGEDKMVIGKIVEESNRSVFFISKENVRNFYPFDQVVRVFRHTQENPETDRIQRYAMPLICPPGMMLVDLPPGKAKRPFFKVCIDKYEYPNKQGAIPQVNISYTDAQNLCEQQGKRLCLAEEWQWACSGLEGFPYSYGWVFDKIACNIDGRIAEGSGNRYKCISKFGVMDMVGNVFEWVKGADGNSAAMGGPLSKCQAVSPGESGGAKPQTGLRCCKSN